MNLSSCEFCGVVYDKDRIKCDDDMYDDDGCIDNSKFRWSSWEDEFLRYIKCPNCRLEIFYETGDEA